MASRRGKAGVVSLSRREIGLICVLALVVVAAWWLQRPQDMFDDAADRGERRPDYVVEGVSGVILDADGLPDRRLDAARLRHYPDDGSSELDEPVLVVYREEGPPWRARSRSARINADGDQVLLQRDVRLSRAATPQSPPVELRTSELLVFPETEYVETDHFVEIERGEDWLTGEQGLHAWLGDDRRAKVFGRVHSRISGFTDDETQ